MINGIRTTMPLKENNMYKLSRTLCLLTTLSPLALTLTGSGPPMKANAMNLELKCSASGSDKRAVVVLRNASTGELLLLASGPGLDYTLRMTGTKGQMVPYTQFGRQTQLPPPNDGKLHPLSFSTQDITLRPGEQRAEEISLEDFFIIPPEGGTFRLEIGRKLRYDDEKATSTLWCKPVTLRIPPVKK